MSISLLLLLVSQLFWLKSEYNEHKRSFYNNADLLFKETVRTLEENLLSRAIANAIVEREAEKKVASPQRSNPKPKKPQIKSFKVSPSEIKQIRLLKINGNDNSDSSKVMVISHANVDSNSNVLDSTLQKNISTALRINSQYFDIDSLKTITKFIAQFHKVNFHNDLNSDNKRDTLKQPRRRYFFRSADLDSVNIAFKLKSEQVGYPVTFAVSKDTIPFDTISPRQRSWAEMHKKLRTAQDTIIINGVPVLNPESISANSMTPNVLFKAKPQNLEKYLFAKIRNNILFSAFLFIVTTITFIIIYRNLKKQARLHALKNDLISNVTHELKTPLATLSVALEALQQFGAAANPETTKEYLEISKNEVNRLSLMVDNILKASLLEKQAICIHPAPLNIEELVVSLSKSWQARFTQIDGTLSLKITGTDFTLEGDEVHITSIINNLMDNAIKYSNEKPNVAITLNSEPNIITLKIKDKGIGIPKEFRDQVFEKFFRVPTGDKHNVKGYGLGLNFVKHIMELHNGKVQLLSDANGSEFTLTFNRKL